MSFFLGNFFPDDFVVDLKSKWKNWKKGPDLLRDVNPYKEMGLKPSDFDIIIFYQYEGNRAATFRFISERGKIGSLVVACGLNPRLVSTIVPGNLRNIFHMDYSINNRLAAGFDFFRVL